MTRCVAGRRDDPDPLRDVDLSTVELVPGIGEVVEPDDRIVLLAMGGIELHLLGEDRRAWEPGVPATVVQMQVAVHDHADVAGRHASSGERLVEGTPYGVVQVLDLGMACGDARIEEDQALRMIDEVAADHDLLARSRVPVVGDREVAERDPSDAIERDHETHSMGRAPTDTERGLKYRSPDGRYWCHAERGALPLRGHRRRGHRGPLRGIRAGR
jgi:hypothetical protein